MRRLLASLLLAVGVALVVIPTATNMWVRAPRGADMISSFKPIMTQQNVALFTDNYMPTLALGFGNVPGAMDQVAAQFGGHQLTYQQAADSLAADPRLADLSYLQRNFASIAVPFTSMLSVMNRDTTPYQRVKGLPPFGLFPYFFVLPGFILAFAAVLVLRRDARQRKGMAAKSSKVPVRVMLVVGVFLVLAPFLPMPPGLHPIWSVAPQGAQMLGDFAGPVDPGGPPIMSAGTVRMFDGYLARMKAGQTEILTALESELPAGQANAQADVLGVIASQPSLGQLQTVLTDFPTMYAKFHDMLIRMGNSLGNYQAVQALPSFNTFPYLFLVPGLIAAIAAGGLLTRRETQRAIEPTGSRSNGTDTRRAEEMVARMLADRERSAPTPTSAGARRRSTAQR